MNPAQTLNRSIVRTLPVLPIVLLILAGCGGGETPTAVGKVAGLFLVGLAGSLGKVYKNPAEMGETIEFVCTEIQLNVLR